VWIVTAVAIGHSVASALLEGNAVTKLCMEKVRQGEPFHHVTAVRRYPGENTGDLHDLHVGPLIVT